MRNIPNSAALGSTAAALTPEQREAATLAELAAIDRAAAVAEWCRANAEPIASLLRALSSEDWLGPDAALIERFHALEARLTNGGR